MFMESEAKRKDAANTDEMTEFALSYLKDKADDVVVSASEGTATYVKVVDSVIDSVVSISSNDISLFVAKGKKLLFTNLGLVGKEGMKKKLDKAMKTAGLLQVNKDYYGIADGPFRYKGSLNYDDRIEKGNYDAEELVSKVVGTALNNGAAYVHGMLTVFSGRRHLMTSGNADVVEKDTGISFSARVFLNKEVSVQNNGASRTISGIDYEALGRDAVTSAKMARTSGIIVEGNYDVIYAPIAAGVLVDRIGSSASIGSVEAGFSFLTDKLGKRVANKDITIYDDASEPDGLSSYVFDYEGVPSQKTTVVKDGVLKTYLHNTSTARKYKTKTTANAGLVSPDSTGTVVAHKNGMKSIEDLVKEVKRGVLVTNVWYTRFSNYVSGEFSTVPRDAAFYVENGEVRYRISMGAKGSASAGIRINDSMPRMLENMEATGGKTIQVYNWDSQDYNFTPALLVRDVKLTSATII